MKRKKALIIFLTAVLLLGTSFMTTDLAQASTQTIKGWFDKNIKVFHNGAQVNLTETPIIHQKAGAAGGTTYIAVRDLAQLLNKSVAWDKASYSVQIADMADQNYQLLLTQVFEKQKEITELTEKVAKLEKELEEAKASKVTTLRDLENYLNDEYYSHNKVDFDFTLTGTTRSMKVKISEKRTGTYEFDDLYTTEVKSYLQSVVNAIHREFKTADVEGTITSYRTNKVVDFYADTKGNVVLERKSGGSSHGDIVYLEKQLNWDHDEYKGAYFKLYAKERNYYIEVDVFVDEYEWKNLSYAEQRTYLQLLNRDIVDEFGNYDVYGTVYDNSYGDAMNTFDFDSSGYANIK